MANPNTAVDFAHGPRTGGLTARADSPASALTLTELARQAAGRAAGTRYRSAITGAWCEPTAPHVAGCICQPGLIGCHADWQVWLHCVATSRVT